MLIPYLVTAPAFKFLQLIGMETCCNALLIFPRVFVTLLSFITDLILFHIASMLGFDANACTMVYATSYVTMVYHTRTLSNTIESFLFVGLLCLVIKCCKRSVTTNAEIHPRSKLTIAKRLVQSPEVESDWYYAIGIGVLVMVGFFNRPTFLLFAFLPCFYWFTNGQLFFWRDPLTTALLTRRAICASASAIPVQWIFVLFDSIYYRDFDISFTYGFFSTIKNFFVFTPLNFIWYNTDVVNLATHTLHPHYLHFAVNAQLLFGFLSIFAFASFIRTLGNLKYLVPNHDYTWKIFLLYCYILPLVFLSVFPHQEPRFLIPILSPLALLYGHHLFGNLSSDVWQVFWVAFNIAMALFYGLLHQGGMLNAINTVKYHHSNQAANQLDLGMTQTHVIFYNTYMPPKHLFAIPEQEEIGTLFVHDMQGKTPLEVISHTQKIFDYSQRPQVFFVAPRTSEHKFCTNPELTPVQRVQFQLLYQFAPHVSTEDLPTWKAVRQALSERHMCTTCGVSRMCDNGMSRGLMGLFSLNLYHVTKK